MNAKLSPLVIILVLAGAVACGSAGTDNGGSPAPSASNPDAGGDDAGNPPPPAPDAGVDAPPAVDHGAPSSTYPAFAPDFVRIKNNGGPVLKNPVVIAISWDTDTAQSAFDTFADTIGETAYWKTTTSEYGVGAAASGTANHVHISTTPPKQVQDSDLQGMVTANAGKGWPAPSAETVYAFFLPPGTSLQTQSPLGGGSQDACAAGEGGYHNQVTAGGVTTAYAVVPSCNFGGSMTPEQQTTMSMSHELIEAATDPNPQTAPAYVNFDDAHFGDSYFQMFQAETGDACEFFVESFFEDKESTPVSFDEWVQRTWSNASGTAGHDPCVPAAGSVYFNVVPLGLETVAVTIPAEVTAILGPGLPTSTQGIKATPGTPVTFPVGFYSDGPTSGPWTLSVSSGNPILAQHGASVVDQYNKSSLTVSVDTASGQNGEKAYLTVNVASAGSLFKGEIVTVTSTLNGVSHYRPIWIGSP